MHTLQQKLLRALRLLCICASSLLLSIITLQSAQAAEIAGIKVADSAQLAGSDLVLNGMGLRTRLMFKVYAGALYVPTKTSSPQDIYAAKVKRLNLHMLRGLDAANLQEALDEGLKNNVSSAQLQEHKAAIAQLSSIMESVQKINEGDVLSLDMTAEGLQIAINQKVRGRVADSAFNNLLLRVWLGEKPVDASLKKGLLGL